MLAIESKMYGIVLSKKTSLIRFNLLTFHNAKNLVSQKKRYPTLRTRTSETPKTSTTGNCLCFRGRKSNGGSRDGQNENKTVFGLSKVALTMDRLPLTPRLNRPPLDLPLLDRPKFRSFSFWDRRGSHTMTENSKRAHWGPSTSQTPPKFGDTTPREE